jgi:DNA-binding YbaB/EbfC family protein
MAEKRSPEANAINQRMLDLQNQSTSIQEDLQSIQAIGYGGAGLVSATLSGEGSIIDLKIDTSVIDPDDPETLTAYVVAAIHEAQAEVREQQKARVGGFLDGLAEVSEGFKSQTERLRALASQSVTPRIPNRRIPPRM